MSLHKQTTWVWTVGITLATLIGASVLMWSQPDRCVAPASVPSHAAETSKPENAPGDRPPLKPGPEDASVSKHDLERATAEMQKQLTALRSQMLQRTHAQASRVADQARPPATPT